MLTGLKLKHSIDIYPHLSTELEKRQYMTPPNPKKSHNCTTAIKCTGNVINYTI